MPEGLIVFTYLCVCKYIYVWWPYPLFWKVNGGRSVLSMLSHSSHWADLCRIGHKPPYSCNYGEMRSVNDRWHGTTDFKSIHSCCPACTCKGKACMAGTVGGAGVPGEDSKQRSYILLKKLFPFCVHTSSTWFLQHQDLCGRPVCRLLTALVRIVSRTRCSPLLVSNCAREQGMHHQIQQIHINFVLWFV